MTPHGGEVARFHHAVAARLGLNFEPDRLPFLASVLRERVKSRGGDVAAYLDELEGVRPTEELRALAPALTVTETYFFRNPGHFQALAEVAIPERRRARAHDQPLRLLSVACASGEEPYSLAMLVRGLPEAAGSTVSIRGIDVNAEMLRKARRGRYTDWALRETPAELRRRWFHPVGAELEVDASIRAMVDFEEQNLAEDVPSLWHPEAYDVVFCRNVLMYLTPSAATALVARIAGALAPGGFLFLGHAESLRGVTGGLRLCNTHGTFYYQRTVGAVGALALPPAAPALSAQPVDTAGWFDAIAASTGKIAALAPAAAATTTRWDLAVAMQHVRDERYPQARLALAALPEEAAHHPDVLLLSAVLFVHQAQLGHAEEACARLLERVPGHAGAHFLLGLCREERGDVAEATGQNQLSAYLDPSFSMPRLRLGMLARRGRRLADAQRELQSALWLLEREDDDRLVLFGGGFGRSGLMALCRAELAACGARQ